MKDVTRKVIAPYFHRAYFEKKLVIPFKKYLSFSDINDVLQHYPILIKRGYEGSIANLIENRYEHWKNNRRINSYEYLKNILRLQPYDKYRPDLSQIWGQLDDLHLEHINTDIRFGQTISYIRMYDNIFQSIDGLIINNIHNNYPTLEIVNDIAESKNKNDLFTIQFIGLPLIYNNSRTLKVGPELLLILNITRQEDPE